MEITIFGQKFRVIVDVPWVGDISEALILMDPLTAGQARSWSNVAISWARSKESSLGYFKANALQHSYWSALMACDSGVGPGKAALFTTAHEFTNCNLDHQDAVDSTMDMHNNSVGSTVIHASVTDPNMPDRISIQQDLMNKLTLGQLWFINEDDNSQVIKTNGKKIFGTP